MPQKVWKAHYQGLEIEFTNAWSFSRQSLEMLVINGEEVSRRETDRHSIKQNITGRHSVVYRATDHDHRVEIVVGSKWPGIFTGCHIFVDGTLVGGDIGSKLMFVS